MNNAINIVTVCDNHYAVMLAALLKSIEVNRVGAEQIFLYIVDDGLKANSKRKISDSVSGNVFKLTWLSLDDVISDKSRLPLDNSTFPLNVYIRLFIPHFVPESLERVLYLDVDMIVETDIAKLWEVDMQGKVIAGVVDRSETVSSKWGGITNYEELGLRPETKYFNSGLLLIDPIKWREEDLTNRILSCVNENSQYAGFPDQYGLNVVLADQWLELDRRWNSYATSDDSDPYVIHFIGVKPIYISYDLNSGFKNRFFHYLSLTPWSGFKPISNNFRLMKKLYNRIVKRWKGLSF
ncbi:lipopolysaccharide biosynthesis glycosyltransferase [Arcticibacter pallidicorallinus]|uniref:Lipopolysaccharide biosynthesis glycosyltransferase n=1 Tax=Arcticibacter pallidicorallinus TaxID=1259464 RepID=A0A2T0U372_9SPHI|nr:glycosyltransferase family 8 protein [Arcticibacter pallidicorallinus]PRY52362.1 lipopolysaccharide biosynthesis glycosyltransferase [Arcticibacter pallidicorallinus]